MIDNIPAGRLLRAAANKIREVGWTRGTALDKDGHVCAVGAIGIVTGCEVTRCNGVQNLTPAFDAANGALAKWLEANGFQGAIIFWNDTYARTMDDVVTGMEKAAAWIEEQA